MTVSRKGVSSSTARRWPIRWTLVASLAAGVVGLAWLTLGRHSSDPASSRPGPASSRVLPPAVGGGPASPPVRICGNNAVLGGGPSSPSKGAVIIRAGDDSGTALAHNWTMQPHTTYWFAPGKHTLGDGHFTQIIPADGDTFIGAPGAIIDGQKSNLYAFAQTASNVTIRYLTIRHFGAPGDNNGQGVVNNGAATGWRIDHVTIRDNAGAGVLLGPDNSLSYSCLQDNGEYGFQAAGSHITVDHNEIDGNNIDNWEVRRPGCGCTGGAKFWSTNGATITSNYVHDNAGPGLWADTNNRDFDVEHNYFANNQGEGFIYETSYNLRLASNTFVRNALIAGPNLGGFPDSAVYISESGADSRIQGSYGNVLAITDNTFTDNWGGVVLWENANRYCSSGANTSTGYCTLVNPSVATVGNCRNPRLIATRPYYDDCRWKTQNVLVRGNDFTFDPARIGPDCTPAKYCGFNGIFSEPGSWKPFDGTVVEDHIAFGQNNHFASNIYTGPWQFVVQGQGNAVTWATWRGNPYNQDAGSTVTGDGQ